VLTPLVSAVISFIATLAAVPQMPYRVEPTNAVVDEAPFAI